MRIHGDGTAVERREGDWTGQKAGGERRACAMSFSPTAEPTKLIFNFLSLIRRGSCYGPLGLYATVLVVLLPWWPSVHGAPLFRGCIILPLETRYFLPGPPLSAPLIAPTSHTYRSCAACTPTGRSTSTCQHGELTAEKPIIHRYVAKNITAIFLGNCFEYASRVDLEAKVDLGFFERVLLARIQLYDVP